MFRVFGNPSSTVSLGIGLLQLRQREPYSPYHRLRINKPDPLFLDHISVRLQNLNLQHCGGPMREALCHSLPRIGGCLEVATVAKDTSQQLFFRDFGRPCSMHQRRHHRRRQCWSLPLSRVCFFSGINFSLIECSRKGRFLLTCQASHASHGAIINRQCCFDSPSLFLMMPAETLSRGTKRTSRMHHHHVTHALESPTLEEFNTEDVESEDVQIGGGQNGSSLQPQSKLNGFTHTNTVGILGGMAALATVDFLRKVVVATPPESDFVPFLVCSDPHLQRFAPVVVQDKTRASAAKLTDVDESSPLSALLEKRRFLEQAGARLIVMPCHASHMWYDQLVEGCTVPFLHIADCVVDELKAMDLRPLEAGNRVKIGVLGTEATLAAGFYQERFKAQVGIHIQEF